MNDGSISEELYQFLATNFHEDWDLEADGWEGVVDNHAHELPVAERLRMLAREIDDMLETRTEPGLKQFLVRTVGVAYGVRPLTYKEWLGQVADRLRQRAASIDTGGASSTR
ncbi:hypothetical protein A5765_14290 [Mycolicibacterium celeriflavum]|uniref:contact-dependent growth inhibition system immunity protein n=1 Tax=Mycolicibacterium celeriflavum TaxID=1249101 RepID=UPI0007FF284A|nr:contact-dependent growth inhibition system immunity protein [Mycolicibacterium celeriflavum]OBG12523.1 hypothetical protein A5765_14290 [Mycolicibacterium celeriflavum]